MKYEQYDSPAASAQRLIETAFLKNAATGIAEYEKQRAAGFSPADESWLDLLGFKILNKKSAQAAVAVWELEAREYPKSWHAYDSLGRTLSLTHHYTQPSAGDELLYTFAYDNAATLDASCPQPSNTKGRMLYRNDSFGTTWFRYDAFGRVLHEGPEAQ